VSKAAGVRFTLDAGSDKLHVAVIGFPVDRVAAWSGVMRADDVDPRSLAEEVARILRDRVQRALWYSKAELCATRRLAG
jgi:hypothetical protein